MRLGEHFLTPATVRPAPVRHIKFKGVGKSLANGEPLVADMEATLVFVDECERQLAWRDTYKELKSVYGDAEIPKARMDEEFAYQFLFRALRDNADSCYRVTFAESVKALKNALTYPVAKDIDAQYNAFAAEEFPESIDQDQFDALVKEAESKSMADLLKERGFFQIRMALASLAVHFGK